MYTHGFSHFVDYRAISTVDSQKLTIRKNKKTSNGKKVFRIAPFHHHLEALGWEEENIVMRLWLIGMILAVTGTIIALMPI